MSDKPRLASPPASEIPEPGGIVVAWSRLLDALQSAWNRSRKTRAGRKRWGKDAVLVDMVRSGRHYSRVEFLPAIGPLDWDSYRLRAEAGWEWTCQNCRTHSLVTESMIAIYTIDGTIYRDDMLKQWEELAASTAARGFKPPRKPTPATAPCPNCRYRPGAPE
jgi:hypothetical protein